MKKKLAALILIMTMVNLLFCTSCTIEKVSKDDPTDLPGDENYMEGDIQNDDPDDDEAAISVSEQVLVDSNGVKVTVTGLDMEEDFLGPELDVTVENNTAQKIIVQTQGVSINGIMMDPIFSCEVAAGKKANDQISFYEEDLDAAEIEVIKDIQLSFHVFDADSWDDIFTTDPITIQTVGSESYTQQYDDSGVVAVDQDGVKIVVKGIMAGSLGDGKDVCLYIENNTQQNIIIQSQDVSIDGVMVDPLLSCEVSAGKKAFDEMIFMESDLTDNNITDINEIEMTFDIFDADTWEDILVYGPVTVTFE
jgi:hypothetical protein